MPTGLLHLGVIGGFAQVMGVNWHQRYATLKD